jgi:hypothetical protein
LSLPRVRPISQWMADQIKAKPGVELTVAAQRQAEAAISTLQRHRVHIFLDKNCRIRFKIPRWLPANLRLLIENQADLMEALLRLTSECVEGDQMGLD